MVNRQGEADRLRGDVRRRGEREFWPNSPADRLQSYTLEMTDFGDGQAAEASADCG